MRGCKRFVGGMSVLSLLNGCVLVQTDNDVVNATSAVMTGVYQQQKIDAEKAKSGKPDIFKTTDPKVSEIDQAIEKARRRKLLEKSDQPK
ncbi:MAG: hypothetical protein KJ930_15350 [Gammaproteobacteria bacterium]|nr:hypothetical protein [Gammaproteobacteria bacterium]MBU2180802.1 hypothetical protein [Gammaproteobacteria bacterium]MBU2426427.1 hypothetical protein [Gammaproteobacteria bacterium]